MTFMSDTCAATDGSLQGGTLRYQGQQDMREYNEMIICY